MTANTHKKKIANASKEHGLTYISDTGKEHVLESKLCIICTHDKKSTRGPRFLTSICSKGNIFTLPEHNTQDTKHTTCHRNNQIQKPYFHTPMDITHCFNRQNTFHIRHRAR